MTLSNMLATTKWTPFHYNHKAIRIHHPINYQRWPRSNTSLRSVLDSRESGTILQSPSWYCSWPWLCVHCSLNCWLGCIVAPSAFPAQLDGTSLALLEMIITVKVSLCPTMRIEYPGRIPYGMELDVSLLVTHAARGMTGSTSKST